MGSLELAASSQVVRGCGTDEPQACGLAWQLVSRVVFPGKKKQLV